MSKVEIHLTSRCKNNCVFCSIKAHPFPDPPIEEIKKDIIAGRRYEKIIFSGGEPTLRKDLVELISYAKKFYDSILLETNGSNLNKNYIKRIAKAGVTEIKIPLHADRKNIHDRITKRNGSFGKVCMVLHNLKDFNNIVITTNTIVTKYNFERLPTFVKWLNNSYPFLSCVQISYPRFYPFKECKRHLLPLPATKKFIIKSIEYSDKIILENVPLCVVNSKCAKNYDWNIKLAICGKIVEPIDKRIYPKKCKFCILKKECQGIHCFYDLYYNTNFIRPFI